jgi:Cytidylyltransferase-like
MAGVGVFPGSFDPLTTAHLAIADAAVEACGLGRLDLVISRAALSKAPGGHSSLDERVAAIERAALDRPRLRAHLTDAQLLADIAWGYDVCVLGADKWHQLHDPAFYGTSTDERDAALARLPLLAVAPRHGVASPPAGPTVTLLDLDPAFHEVSSTAVRAGRHDWRA